MKRVFPLLLMLLALPCWAANDFSSDGNIVCVLNFEGTIAGGDFMDSSKGTTDFTNAGFAEQATAKVGSKSAESGNFQNDYAYRVDGSDMPLYSSGGNQNVSLCFWIYIATEYGAESSMAGKVSDGTTSMSLHCTYNGSTHIMGWEVGYNSGDNTEELCSMSGFQTGRWFHVGFTYAMATKAYVFRVWDDTAGDYLAADQTGTGGQAMYLSADDWRIGQTTSTQSWQGFYYDEFVFATDILTTGEIDSIRAGTFGAGAATAAQVISTDDLIRQWLAQ